MSSQFGGGAPGVGHFQGHNIIKDFLRANMLDFSDMVISHSVILKAYERKMEEVIRVGYSQVYPRIGLILCAAKNLDNTLLFGVGPSSPQLQSGTGYTAASYSSVELSFQLLRDNVLNFITSDSSPFAEGITNVAAALTASILIRQLPINADVKNVDLGNRIEEQAIADLDRIIFLYQQGRAVEEGSLTLPAPSRSKQTIYIAMDIDRSTLPPAMFNDGDLKTPKRLDETDPEYTVRTERSLSIDDSQLAWCYYYISPMEGQPLVVVNANALTDPIYQINPGVSVPPPKEGIFFIEDGWDANNIIEVLADEINAACLNPRDPKHATNIILSPNHGETLLSNVVTPKKKIYPDIIDDPYERKILAFRMIHQVNYLTFAARRRSNIVDRELIIVKFYSANKTDLALDLIPNLDNYTYRGRYREDFTYNAGNIVDVSSGSQSVSYIAKTNNVKGETPASSSPNWKLLFSDSSDFKSLRKNPSVNPYINGLVYGLSPTYAYLEKQGPVSITLEVRDGDVKAITAKQDLPSELTPEGEDVNDYVIDCFWFRLSGGNVTGTLKLNISSFDVTQFPNILSGGNINPDGTIDVSFTAADAEEVAIAVLLSLYPLSQATDVLAALVHSSTEFGAALQFTAFKKTPLEIKEVIDILNEVAGLEVATGTWYRPITPFRIKPRSLIIDATTIDKLTATQTPNNSELINEGYNPGVTSVSHIPLSSRIQHVYDKISFLNRFKNNC
jgi:hypothetical protein